METAFLSPLSTPISPSRPAVEAFSTRNGAQKIRIHFARLTLEVHHLFKKRSLQVFDVTSVDHLWN